ncbi:3681_t:CDS:2 [Cetraspora pellucida]|uniref:3681_t:CDS:1 n=1 Tax=Cetraspora pellucida TaxID=1433469 RepID=A0ACA9JY39_9GLOM|nr:3681_t:CDS:2 [Cetraspora pellucida]
MSLHNLLDTIPDAISSAIEVNASLKTITSSISGMDTLKTVINAASVAGDAIQPILPMINIVLKTISEIINIIETAENNKNICNILMDRVDAAQMSIKTLLRHQQENKDKFQSPEYQKNFQRFVTVIEEIKIISADISKLKRFSKFWNAYSVKAKVTKAIEDFDTVLKDLSFTMIIANEERRRLDTQGLERDISELINFAKCIDEKSNTLMTEVRLLKSALQHQNNAFNSNSILEALKINSIDIVDPQALNKDNIRGKIFKRIYKKAQEVACKKLEISVDDQKDIKKFVMAGGHEKISYGTATSLELQKEYANIIRSAWKTDPRERENLQAIFLALYKLVSIYAAPGKYRSLFPEKSLDLDGFKKVTNEDCEDCEDFERVFKANQLNMRSIITRQELEKCMHDIKCNDYPTSEKAIYLQKINEEILAYRKHTHDDEDDASIEQDSESTNQLSIHPHQKKLHHKLLKTIIFGNIPFSFIENPYLQDYLHDLNSSYNSSSWDMIKGCLLTEMFSDHIQKKLNTLPTLKDLMISLDRWTDNSGNSIYRFMALKEH